MADRAAGDLSMVRRLGHLLEAIHAVVYFAPEALAAYEQLGLRGYWRGYFAGRCAAAGPIGPELATALLGGFAPSMVARAIPDVWSIAEPADVATARSEAAASALQRLIIAVDPAVVGAAAEMTARCVESLPLAGRPMAAAHRALPRPSEPVRALWHDATVLREYRGDGHLAVIAAAGMQWPEPHLLISDRLDSAQQVHRGWSDQEWATARQRALGVDPARIDDHTDRLAAPAFQPLSGPDTLALAAALAPLAHAAAAQLPFPNAMGLPRPAPPDPPSASV